MFKIQKTIFCISALVFFSLNGVCDTTVLKELKTLQGKALFEYVESMATQQFGSFESLFDDRNDEILSNGLSKKDIKEWLSLYDCIVTYLYSIQDYTQRINYAQKFNVLKEIVNKLPTYAQNIKNKRSLAQVKESLTNALEKVTEIFLVCLNLLPPMEFQNIGSVNEILNSYKNHVGVAFDPKAFFDAYKKHKNYYKAENKIMTPVTIFNFLYGTNILADRSNANSGVYRKQQQAIANFIYMLEQLLYASQNTKNTRWSIKKMPLTFEQIAMGKNIIKALYTLFPGVEVLTLSLENVDKPLLMLLAQSRALLIVLQNFKRTVDDVLTNYKKGEKR